jgi:ABC-type amino acid transport substrate-binding protein
MHNAIFANRGLRPLISCKKTASLLSALLITILLASGAAAAGTSAPLRIAVDAPYYPFAYTDPETGDLTGFDVELAQALCREIKRQCSFEVMPFNEIIPAIVAGRADMAVAGMGKTPEREKHVIFTDKYFRSNSIYVACASCEYTQSDFTLKNKTIAVQTGTVQEKHLLSIGVPSKRIVKKNNVKELFKAIHTKEADMALVDGVGAYAFLKTDEGSHFVIVGEPVMMPNIGDAHIVLHPSLTEERDALNRAILTLRKNGVYSSINRKYFSFSIY